MAYMQKHRQEEHSASEDNTTRTERGADLGQTVSLRFVSGLLCAARMNGSVHTVLHWYL
jgi:hypothetical protein